MINGWPQRTRGSRRSLSARAKGRPLLFRKLKNPHEDWKSVGAVAVLDGLCTIDNFFFWRMLHSLHPTQERLNRLRMRTALIPFGTNCNLILTDSLSHSLISDSSLDNCPSHWEKKRPQLFQTRAKIEADIEILIKTKFLDTCIKIEIMIHLANS